MAVPNNYTFKFSDVKTELASEGKTINTLTEAFTQATQSYFDDNYKEQQNELTDFRNYGPSGPSVPESCGTNYNFNSSVGSYPIVVEYEISSSGRSFVNFKTSGIPDRVILKAFNGSIQYDSGYICTSPDNYQVGGSTRSSFNAFLNGKIDPVSGLTYPNINIPNTELDGYPEVRYVLGNDNIVSVAFPLTSDIFTAEIYSFSVYSVWVLNISCPEPFWYSWFLRGNVNYQATGGIYTNPNNILNTGSLRTSSQIYTLACQSSIESNQLKLLGWYHQFNSAAYDGIGFYVKDINLLDYSSFDNNSYLKCLRNKHIGNTTNKYMYILDQGNDKIVQLPYDIDQFFLTITDSPIEVNLNSEELAQSFEFFNDGNGLITIETYKSGFALRLKYFSLSTKYDLSTKSTNPIFTTEIDIYNDYGENLSSTRFIHNSGEECILIFGKRFVFFRNGLEESNLIEDKDISILNSSVDLYGRPSDTDLRLSNGSDAMWNIIYTSGGVYNCERLTSNDSTTT